MRRIKSLKDVVDWGLCVGCGACSYLCKERDLPLVNIESLGIRPRMEDSHCGGCVECLSVCPGYNASGEGVSAGEGGPAGPFLEIWEGKAADPDVRFLASSGGALTALALYCLEREGMTSVLHTAMDPERPWLNKTVLSRSRSDLTARCGSRYAPSSPCEGLGLIENVAGKSVFIGKPCDAAAVSRIAGKKTELDGRIGLTLTFFCAGPPCTRGTLDLIKQLGIAADEVTGLRYRGRGWPGEFVVQSGNASREKSLSYRESWGFLAKYPRSFRCHLCPDGLGEQADLSCGDAWHRYRGDGDPGQSLIIVRTERGRDILYKAMAAGYLDISPSGLTEVLAAQELIERKKGLFGRLLALRLFLAPTPIMAWRPLWKEWISNPPEVQVRTLAGTIRRILLRGLWHKKSPFKDAVTSASRTRTGTK